MRLPLCRVLAEPLREARVQRLALEQDGWSDSGACAELGQEAPVLVDPDLAVD